MNYIKEKIGKKPNKIKNDFVYLEENGLKIQGDKNVSKHITEFFSTIGSNLSRKIIKTHLHPQRLNRIDSSIFIRPIDTTEIRNAVQAMKDKEGGVDGINTTVL